MPKPSKSSASAGTRKKHAKKAVRDGEEQENRFQQQVKRQRGEKKLSKAQQKSLPKVKQYIPPPKPPAPPIPDPLDGQGLARTLPAELVVVLRRLGKKDEVTRRKGLEELKEGWKTDFSDGVIDLEFSYRPTGSPRPLCDMISPTGLTISHALVVELVVSEEWATLKRPDQPTPTGSARVLRMQFPLVVTERAGMGISWDEEQPPMYEDVPASPPLYAAGQQPRSSRSIAVAFDAAATSSMARNPSAQSRAETFDYTGPPLDEPSPLEEIERLNLGEARAGPSVIHSRQELERSSLDGVRRGRLAMDDFDTEGRERRWRDDREGTQEVGEDRGTGELAPGGND